MITNPGSPKMTAVPANRPWTSWSGVQTATSPTTKAPSSSRPPTTTQKTGHSHLSNILSVCLLSFAAHAQAVCDVVGDHVPALTTLLDHYYLQT